MPLTGQIAQRLLLIYTPILYKYHVQKRKISRETEQKIKEKRQKAIRKKEKAQRKKALSSNQNFLKKRGRMK